MKEGLFNLNHHTFIPHPSSFILFLEVCNESKNHPHRSTSVMCNFAERSSSGLCKHVGHDARIVRN